MDTDPDEQQGRIVRLEVESFKSYRGHQNIGPFKRFTAVVGPNGSGKSNLMDAISFVLGVRTAHLRGNLRELLYSNSDGKTNLDKPSKGYVKLVYEAADGEEIHFCRVIMPSGASVDAPYQSQYKINDRTVSWEVYNEKLKGFNILVKARNFLVFQGDIESVAAKSAKDLTTLFENVSGSESYKKEYETAEQRKNAAEEKFGVISSRKKIITAERKQKKEQKEEAVKHLKMQEELERQKTEYYLWQLYHIDKDISKAKEEMEKQQEDLREAAERLMLTDREVEEKKQVKAGFDKERLGLEKNMKRRRAELEKNNPQAVKTKEEVSRLEKKIKRAETELKENKRSYKEQQAKTAKLQVDLENILAAQQQLEDDIVGAKDAKVHLSNDLRSEYNTLQAEAGAKTSKLQQDKDSQQAALQTEIDALQTLDEAIKSIDDRLKQLETDCSLAQQHRDEVVIKINDAKKELLEKKAERGQISDDNRRSGAKRDYLKQKLEEVEAKLRDAKADRKESERDRAMADAVERMKQNIPGVYGRVTDLAKVSHRRYNLAMAVVLGKDMDGVVVDTDRTAKECIQFLKEQRVERMTFHPVASVKAKPVNERLRQLGGTAKLALDLLEYDPQLERVFLSICGNTLVCDSDEEGKQLAYRGPERHKVATLNGTLFNKQGLITGGYANNMEARASRWDEQMLENLKQERAKCDTALRQLPDEREAREAEERVSAEVARLEHEIQYGEADVTATQQKLAKYEGQAASLREEREAKQPQADKLRAEVERRQAEIDKKQARINDIKDRIFAPFSAKVGVSNYREYDEKYKRAEEEGNARKMVVATQASKISNDLVCNQKSNLQQAKAIQEKEREIEADRKRMEELKEAEAEAAAAAQKIEGALGKQLSEIAALRKKAEEVEAAIKELRSQATQQQAQGAKVKRQVTAREAQVEQLRTKRSDVLEAASMEQVTLPRLDGEEEDMEVDGGSEDPGPSAQAEAAALDYSSLKRQYMATAGAKEREKLDAEFKASIEEMSATLTRLAPNLKAVEQYEAVRDREREQQEELEAARREVRAATEAFNAVYTKRLDAFTAAFDHISAQIDPIFKDLTRSKIHPVGGQAYLSLESTEEPFLHGVKFTAMPPTKRFRDMEQLSGGEKTVAALALLFAIHSYQPSPFFVLDEVDAALDATNVARVAKYIREKTREAPGSFQSIVISLKDNFFQNADALVGVCRDPDLGCSATFTFDLTRYDG